MAKLYFYYSAMNAGKTTTLLQSAHNYHERGMRTLLLTPRLDTRAGEGVVASRIGLQAKGTVFTRDDDLERIARDDVAARGPLGCVLIDEAQFLSKAQVWQLTEIVDALNVPVLAGWRSGPSVVLEDTPLQRAPAVFLTLSSNGYGALVPRFHAQSRWVNLGHQMVIGPGQPEYKDVRALLTAPLPKYLVAPADPPKGSQVAQPSEGLRQRLNQDLHHHQLALADELCSMVRSNLLSKSLTDSDRAPSARAFWICPLRAESSPVPPTTKPDEATLAAFSSVEAHCPRFFPSGQGITRRDEGQWLRYYPSTDFHAYLDDTGYVSYKYFLSYSAVTIGTAEDVRAGRLQLDCARPRGRYRPPWVTG